ncbi:energy transducer TonB [Parasphingorhabdus sp.]|uniref:energy transducer TonB n=1 Tax=Parasphingorhabdus sp. TaxID=2709688 RepID=UPI0032632CD3
MFRTLLIVLSISSCMISLPVRAEVYEPHSPWNIHYGETACDLKRIFKGKTGQIQIQISQAFDLGGASFYLTTAPVSKERYWEADVDFSIDETGAKLKKNGSFLRIRNENLLVWQIYGFELDFLEDLPNDVTLRLKSKKYPELALKLTGMKSISNALEQCQRNLYETFGVDYSQIESLLRQPEPNNPGRWLKALDYPSTALRRGFEGTVHFMLAIDTEGQTEKCIILRSSGHKSLDDHACAVLEKRSRFIPALDKRGEKVASTWISSVRWQIPK